MNYAQLIKRVKSNKLPTRKMGDLFVSDVPEGMTEDHAIEIISMTQVAWKYRAAYESGGDIPDDLTDEIFACIAENKAVLNRFDPGDLL